MVFRPPARARRHRPCRSPALAGRRHAARRALAVGLGAARRHGHPNPRRSAFPSRRGRPARRARRCPLVRRSGSGAARREIGRAHVSTPVTNAHLVCRLLLEKKNNLTPPFYPELLTQRLLYISP